MIFKDSPQWKQANSITTKIHTEYIWPRGKEIWRPGNVKTCAHALSACPAAIDRGWRSGSHQRRATAYAGILHFTLLHTETPTWRLQIPPHILRSNSAVPRRGDRFSVHVDPLHVTYDTFRLKVTRIWSAYSSLKWRCDRLKTRTTCTWLVFGKWK